MRRLAAGTAAFLLTMAASLAIAGAADYDRCVRDAETQLTADIAAANEVYDRAVDRALADYRRCESKPNKGRWANCKGDHKAAVAHAER